LQSILNDFWQRQIPGQSHVDRWRESRGQRIQRGREGKAALAKMDEADRSWVTAGTRAARARS
jgi:hypothetical protein